MTGGYSVIFCYRSGRPDCLALLLTTGLIYCYSLTSTWRRHFCFLILGMLSPWIGLQLLPFIVVASALLLLYLGREVWPTIIATLIGAATEGLALVFFYVVHGVLGGFLRSIKQHTVVGVVEVLISGHLRHSNFIPKVFSFLILFGLALVLTAYQFKNGTFNEKPMLSFALVWSIVLSIALVAAGTFPTYYGWMTYVPLSVCLCSALPDLALSRKLFATGVCFIGAAITVGISLNVMAASTIGKTGII